MSRRRRRTLLAAAAVALTLAAPAGAIAAPPAGAGAYHAGQRPAAAGELGELVSLGLEFWQARDVHPCAARAWVVPGLILEGTRTADGAALRDDTLGVCEFWVAGELLDGLRRERRLDAYDDTRPEDRYLCAVVFHELGHLGGLGHTTGPGLMSGDAGEDAIVTPSAPWACRLWARHRFEVLELRRELRRTRLELRRLRHQPRSTAAQQFSNRG